MYVYKVTVNTIWQKYRCNVGINQLRKNIGVQSNLDRLQRWCEMNKMFLSFTKYAAISFKRKARGELGKARHQQATSPGSLPVEDRTILLLMIHALSLFLFSFAQAKNLFMCRSLPLVIPYHYTVNLTGRDVLATQPWLDGEAWLIKPLDRSHRPLLYVRITT